MIVSKPTERDREEAFRDVTGAPSPVHPKIPAPSAAKASAEHDHVTVPARLVDEFIGTAKDHFILLPNIGFAMARAGALLRQQWRRDGKTLVAKPDVSEMLNPPNGVSANQFDTAIANARARWNEAKALGDPGQMTRTANDLLRAVEGLGHNTGLSLARAIGEANTPSHPVSDSIEAGDSTSARPAGLSVPAVSAPDAIGGVVAPEEEVPTPPPASRADSVELAYAKGSDARGDQYSAVYPTDPNGGLDRVRRSRRRGQRFEPPGEQRDWVDPAAGWDQETIDETIRESGGREVTPELLLIFSNEAYPDDRSDPVRVRARGWRRQTGPRSRPRGWELVDEEKGDDYYGMAVYDPDTNTLVIANRGTFAWSYGDRETDYEIIAGNETRQAQRAGTLLVRAWRRAAERARREGKPPPRLVLTGHSLGGALAQVQLARTFADPLFRDVNVRGVTFAALGSDRVVGHVLRRWNRFDPGALRGYASDRMINYVRQGDGVVQQRAASDYRYPAPERIGSDVILAGIDMPGLESVEAEYQRLPEGSAGRLILAKEIYYSRYVQNHSLRSYYHRDFGLPLGLLFDRRRPRSVH